MVVRFICDRAVAAAVMSGVLLGAMTAAEALTLGDIAGAKIEFTLVSDRMIRVNGNTKPQRAVQTTHLSINADQSFAREDGVGRLVSSSSMSGGDVELLSSKPVSSACRLSR